MKRKVEIFTANCPVCDPVVGMVKDLACDTCELTIYDLVKQCEDKSCVSKINEYGIKKLPAIAIDGKLLDCCKGNSITKEKLIEAGIGRA